jgi:regulation of enolase protein 1 (concanavalin A-like superfamily)
MHRLAVLLLCCLLVGVAAVAAPAPVFKPDRTRWLGLDGWDGPVYQAGVCTIVRDGGRLTISMPPHAPDQGRNFSLVRDAEGDFTFTVRLEVDVRQRGDEGSYRAGIVLSGGETTIDTGLWAHRGDGCEGTVFYGYKVRGGGGGTHCSGSTATPIYFRLTRRAGTVLAEYNEDGEHWNHLNDGRAKFDLPMSVKVGVMAEVWASDDGSFVAAFDQFSLTPLK